MMEIGVIGCRFNHQFGERCLAMWRYLAEHYKVKVHIFTTDRWIDKKGDSEIKDTKYLRIHKLLTVGAKYGQFKHMMPGLPFAMMANPQIKIFYAQEEPIQMGVTWPAYWTAKYMKKPFMFFTWENLYQRWFFPINAIENQIIKGSDVLIAGTSDARRILTKKGANFNKIVVLPETGIDTDIFKPVKKHKPVRTILYIGRLVPEKGIDVLLRAREILRERRKDYRYIFIGDGPLRSRLCSLMERYDDVIVKKPVPYKEVPEAYHLGNVFFYASLKTKKWVEQYGYSMLEALASGLPVIGSKVTGPSAIIKEAETGFLIPPGDVKSAAHRISLLLDHPETLRYYSKKARKDATTRLSKEAVAKRTYELLRKVVNCGTKKKD